MRKIVWDEPKRLANLDLRGLDFQSIPEGWIEAADIYPAKRGRFMALGYLNGQPVSVVFAFLGSEAFSVVTMRIASEKERRLMK